VRQRHGLGRCRGWHEAMNYIIQDGCHNCIHVFTKHDYEQQNEYYCTFYATNRPPCLSVSMHESPDDEIEWYEAYENWQEWKKDREVNSYGRCDLWKN